MIETHPSQLKLKTAYWFVTHKVLLKKIGLFIIFIILFSFIGYGLYGFADYSLNFNEHDKLTAPIIENLINFKAFKIKIQPTPLKPGSVDILKAGQNKYDFLITLKNSDDRWFIKEITYQFAGSGFSSPESQDFILPSQNKFLLNLNQNSSPSSLNLKIIDIQYERVRVPPDVSLEDFEVEAAEYIPSDGSPLSQPRVKFKVTNNSIYNFWEVPFKIILYSRSLPVAVNITSITQFKSGESRNVEVVWLESQPRTITRVLPIPDVNLFDAANYMPAEFKIETKK